MDTCPNCGADVPKGAKACPECGSDEETGWSDQARYDGLDLPEENFDYGDFVKREFGGKSARPAGVKKIWLVVAVGLVVLAVFLFLSGVLGH